MNPYLGDYMPDPPDEFEERAHSTKDGEEHETETASDNMPLTWHEELYQ